MGQHDLAAPTLPSRSISDTGDFYHRLGFEGGPHDEESGYAILSRGPIEIHFSVHRELQPAASSAGCFLRMLDFYALYAACQWADLPRAGIPRMDLIRDKPWGLREFALVDSRGNLLRIGQII